jgi:hypothetical protein
MKYLTFVALNLLKHSTPVKAAKMITPSFKIKKYSFIKSLSTTIVVEDNWNLAVARVHLH